MVSLDVRGIICNGIRNAEINQLQLTFYQYEVRWLEIRVDNLFFVKNMHGLQHLVRRLVRAVRELGRVNVLVSNSTTPRRDPWVLVAVLGATSPCLCYHQESVHTFIRVAYDCTYFSNFHDEAEIAFRPIRTVFYFAVE